MAEYKDYIVRYDIITDVTKAAEGLQTIANIAKEFEGPMNTLRETISQVSKSVQQLKQNSQIKFAPEISTSQFSNQLRKMVTETENAAAKMHAAIFNALSGNPLGKKVAQQGSANGFQLAKGSQALRSQLDSNLKLIEEQSQKIQGLQKILRTSLTDVQRENAEKSLRSAQLIKKGLQVQNKDILTALKEAEETEKRAAKATTSKAKKTKSKSSAQTTTVSRSADSQSAKLTNVTTTVIREWERVFGNAKSKVLTIKIRGNATGTGGALTVIEQIQTSLKALQAQGTFNINPILNTEAFAATEAQLTRLASLSAAVVSPFTTKDGKTKSGKGPSLVSTLTKDEKTKLTNAQNQIKTWNEKIAPIQSRLDANKAIPEDQRTPAIKGQITRDTKTLATYRANKAEQENIVRGLQGKSATAVKTTTATAKPLALDVVGNLSKINITAKVPIVSVVGKITKLQSKVSEAIPVNVKIMADQVQASLRSIPTPTLDVKVQLITDKAQQQLRTLTAQSKPVKTPTTTPTTPPSKTNVAGTPAAPITKGKKVATTTPIAGSVDAKDIINQIKNIPRQTIPVAVKLMWERGAVGRQEQIKKLAGKVPPITLNLDTSAALVKLEEFIAKVRAASPQNIRLTANGNVTSTKGVANPNVITGGSVQTSGKQAGHTGHQKLGAKNTQSIAQHKRQANILRAQAQNAMLPFAQNKEQLNILTKHRRYFRQAVAATGIMPTPSMEAPQMLKYLQGVSSQMQKSSVAVPWQLQNQINKLEGNIAKSKGIGEYAGSRSSGIVAASAEQKPFFDRARKWAYPLTGQTSFGARTPMAVDMAKGMGVMYAIGGAMSAIGSSFSQATEYQNTMRTTQAILQNGSESYTNSSFKNMERTVRDVGVKTKFSAPEVASAARFLAMAGYDIDAINASIRPIADIALIGDFDLGETADKMTNIMTTFQIAPERMREAADIMTTTATRTNTDLMMLAESAKYGGGVANMYGKDNPYLFADTMALFGVMGNSGIQGSSAGTALRMMYQNIFNPNKKQQAVLKTMADYGVVTVDKDGKNRSLADIVIDMANKIPADLMPKIVGNLFRITAQAGANATLVSAKDIALEDAGGDANTAANLMQITNDFVSSISGKDSKEKLSVLASLLHANRNAVGSNISGATAGAKQSTIQGLWAQVTSTFTEGVLKAFEQRQGGFESMLIKLRDYLAKPETVQMLQNLLDMIVEIGKVMAWFVKIWAGLYNMAPQMIKWWVTIQMGLTQIGALVGPVISLMGAFNSLRTAISSLAGVSLAATAGSNVTSLVGGATAYSMAPLVVGQGANGAQYISGNIAARARKQIDANALMVGGMALTDAAKQSKLQSLNEKTAQHYAAVKSRAERIYGREGTFKAGAGKLKRIAVSAASTAPSLTMLSSGLKTVVFDLFSGLAKAVGLLVNPFTLVAGVIGVAGYNIWKTAKRLEGTTPAQIQRRERTNELMDVSFENLKQGTQWYSNLNSKNIIHLQALPESKENVKKRIDAENERKVFQQRFGFLLDGFTKDSSKPQMRDAAKRFTSLVNSNSLYGYALGDEKDELTKDLLNIKHNTPKTLITPQIGTSSIGNWGSQFIWDENNARPLQNKLFRGMVMLSAVDSPKLKEAVAEVEKLQKKQSKYSPNEYEAKIEALRNDLIESHPQAFAGPSGGLQRSIPITDYYDGKFSKISDPSIFDVYQNAELSIFDAVVKKLPGTNMAALDAQKMLAERSYANIKEWDEAVSRVANNYRIYDQFISADKQRQANLGIVFNIMPDGTIDFSALKYQIEEKIGAFNSNLLQYANLMASFYSSVGLPDEMLKDPTLLHDKIYEQLQNVPVTEQDAIQYYQDYVYNNPNSPFWNSGWTQDDFVGHSQAENKVPDGWFGTKKNLKFLSSIGKYATPNTLQNLIRQERAAKATNETVKANKDGGASSFDPSKDKNDDENKTNFPANDQSPYASAYDRSAAKPTQVIININELAHFDRTSVASSADEKDLMAAMESRIANAVYQIFAEASNQAQMSYGLA